MELQRVIEGEGQMPKVWEIPGKEVTGYALPKLERRGEGSYSIGKRRGRRGRKPHDLPDVVPDMGRVEALPN